MRGRRAAASSLSSVGSARSTGSRPGRGQRAAARRGRARRRRAAARSARRSRTAPDRRRPRRATPRRRPGLGRVVRPLRQQRRLAPARRRHHDAEPRSRRWRATVRATGARRTAPGRTGGTTCFAAINGAVRPSDMAAPASPGPVSGAVPGVSQLPDVASRLGRRRRCHPGGRLRGGVPPPRPPRPYSRSAAAATGGRYRREVTAMAKGRRGWRRRSGRLRRSGPPDPGSVSSPASRCSARSCWARARWTPPADGVWPSWPRCC